MILNGKCYVDRSHFMAWNEGILLHFEHGNGFYVNETECSEAGNLLEAGETITLTVNGNSFSTVKKTNEGYVETKEEKNGEYNNT